MKHTPTPWKFTPPRFIESASGEYIVDWEPGVGEQADMEFIVKACNSHAALLEALEKAESFLDRDGKIAWHVKADLITDIRIAIAKAKAEQS